MEYYIALPSPNMNFSSFPTCSIFYPRVWDIGLCVLLVLWVGVVCCGWVGEGVAGLGVAGSRSYQGQGLLLLVNGVSFLFRSLIVLMKVIWPASWHLSIEGGVTNYYMFINYAVIIHCVLIITNYVSLHYVLPHMLIHYVIYNASWVNWYIMC